MMKSGTALVVNGVFFHYCHKINSLMALRIHYSSCPLCKQENPDYIQNKIIYTVSDLTTGNVILAFDDEQKAISYMKNHPQELWCLGDTGHV